MQCTAAACESVASGIAVKLITLLFHIWKVLGSTLDIRPAVVTQAV